MFLGIICLRFMSLDSESNDSLKFVLLVLRDHCVAVNDWFGQGQTHPPQLLLEDAAANEQKPHVDLYTCGFPCQPYSFLLLR